MIRALLELLGRHYDAQRHRDLLAALWAHERWFDTPRQRKASELTAAAMKQAGLTHVKIVAFAADGRQRYQDWTTRLAWECTAAELSLDNLILARRQDVPQAVVQWSAPLAPGTYPVVDLDAPQPPRPQAMEGALLLTSRPPSSVKPSLRGTNAAGLISDCRTLHGDDDATRWTNAWSDSSDSWYFRATDQPLTGFCLSPRLGAALRAQMAQRDRVQLHAFCNSRLYAGTSQCVTGILPGKDPTREVWIYGHGLEAGANDNASGVSTLICALALLRTLIAAGRLAPPRFSIRVVITEECLGMLAFLTLHPEWARAAVAGLNLDICGDIAPDRPLLLDFGPLANPSFGWVVAGNVARALAELDPAFVVRLRRRVPIADDMIADPLCDVPSTQLQIGNAGTGYHSSADIPAVCQPNSLRQSCLATTAWAYLMSTLDNHNVPDLLHSCVAWLRQHVCRDEQDALGRWAARQALCDLHRWGIDPQVYHPHMQTFAIDQQFMQDPAATRYRRSTFGTLTFDRLAPQGIAPLNRWHTWQAAAGYWLSRGCSIELMRRLVTSEVKGFAPADLDYLVDRMLAAGLAESVATTPP